MQTPATLRLVEEGMRVFDSEHHEIGKVEFVRFGDDDPDTPEMESNGLSAMPEPTLVDEIADLFGGSDDLPQEIRERLYHQGFVRIDADGLFASDRYVTPDQIESVSGDGVMLNVSKDDLLKKH